MNSTLRCIDGRQLFWFIRRHRSAHAATLYCKHFITMSLHCPCWSSFGNTHIRIENNKISTRMCLGILVVLSTDACLVTPPHCGPNLSSSSCEFHVNSQTAIQKLCIFNQPPVREASKCGCPASTAPALCKLATAQHRQL